MDIPVYSTVIIKLFGLLDSILTNYVSNGYQALASHLMAPLGLAVTLYIMVVGLSITNGWRRMSMPDFMKDVFRIGLIYMFAMNWGTFSFFSVQGIEVAFGQVGNWLIAASPIPVPNFAGEGINGALQSVLIEVTKVGSTTWDMGSFTTWGPLFTAIMIWFFGYLMLALAVIEILLAELMLAILFAVAPLFIAFTLFKPTQGMFERWIGAICGFGLVLVFVPAAVALGLNFMQWAIGGYYAEVASGLNISIVGWVPLMIVSILCVTLILSVTGIAKSIGGSVSCATGTAMLGGAVGGFIGGAFSSHQAGRMGMAYGKTAATTALKAGANLMGSDAGARSTIMDSLRNGLRKGK